VVTSIIAVDGSGEVKEYGGGYDDYQRARQAAIKPDEIKSDAATRSSKKDELVRSASGSKLSFKEQRELEALPKKIENLESQQAKVHQEMAEADFYKQAPEKIVAANNRLATIQADLVSLYARWEKLEAL